MKFKKPALLTRVIIALILGVLSSYIFPEWAVRVFVTINSIFSNYLGFIIPLIIIGLVALGIADLGKGAGKILIITASIAYASTLLSGFFSYFTTRFSLPLVMGKSALLSGGGEIGDVSINPLFTIEMPPLLGVTSALVLAFVVGLTLTVTGGNTIRNILHECYRSLSSAFFKK